MKEYTYKSTFTDDIERLETLERVTKACTSILSDRPNDKFTISTGVKESIYYLEVSYIFAD